MWAEDVASDLGAMIEDYAVRTTFLFSQIMLTLPRLCLAVLSLVSSNHATVFSRVSLHPVLEYGVRHLRPHRRVLNQPPQLQRL